MDISESNKTLGYSSLAVDSGTALIDSVSRFSEPAWKVFERFIQTVGSFESQHSWNRLKHSLFLVIFI